MRHITHAMVDSTTILLVMTTILTGFFIWSRRTYVYWQRRCVKFAQPTHLLGNLKAVLDLRNTFALQLRDFYFDDRFVKEPLVGIYLFHQPALLIRDLELVRRVLVDDSVSFSNRFATCDSWHDKLGAFNLFFVKNPEWREIRTRLSPAFASANIKHMFSLMEEVGSELETYLQKLTARMDRNATVVQIKDICDLYNTDLIASIAFGLRSYSLRNKQSEIGVYCRQMFAITSVRRAIDFCVIFFLPKLVKLLHPKLFTPAQAHYFRRSILAVIEERDQSGIFRNDLIEMLLTLKKESDLHTDRTTVSSNKDYLAAQAAFFEVFGIETCSATMAFALYELAKSPHVQERLRHEIEQTFGSAADPVTYDKIMSMEYLSMVLDETLRKYPVLPFIERVCSPVNRKRFYSFRPHAECFARRDMPVYISNLAIHSDPKYWPQPEQFKPERFSPQNRQFHAPMSYIPFGAGPRSCIGISLGLLQIKLGLIHFLRSHRVEPCDKTVETIKFDPKFALLSNENGIHLNVVKCR